MYTQAELMNPSLDGLGSLSSLSSLSCGKGCHCDDCSSLQGIGLGDIPWSCSTFGLFCQDPITQTKLDISNYGEHLSQENRDRATSMAVENVEADMKKNPCAYSENTGMSEIEKMLKCGQVNWWLVGGVVLVGAMIIKKI